MARRTCLLNSLHQAFSYYSQVGTCYSACQGGGNRVMVIQNLP